MEGRESAICVVPKKRVGAVLQWLYTGIMPATTEPLDEKIRVVSLRIPPILALRMDTAVLDRKRDYPKFSMNDWIIEAMREKLDGPPEGVLVTKETMRSFGMPTIPDLSKIPSDPKVGFGRDPMALLGLKNTASAGVLEEVDPWYEKCVRDHGRGPVSQGKQHIPGWAGMTWEQKHQALADKKKTEMENGGAF